VVLVSRGDPPAALARLRANRTLSLIGWDELPRRRVALVAHGGVPLTDLDDLEPPIAFLLGSEREGLPGDLDGEQATIPLPGDAESLNVAAAGAIALYELSRHDG